MRLTATFLTWQVLAPGGMLTILSDNGRYARVLATTLGSLRCGGGGDDAAPLLASVSLGGGGAEHYEDVGGVRLYHGVPTAECGHGQVESSYFDRLWEYRQGAETERFYLVVRRAE